MNPQTQMSPRVILVIEDAPLVGRLLSLNLGRAGFAVHVAADGETGVRLARALRPHLILTDIFMPGLDGIEVGRRIRSDPALCQIPIFTMTVCATPEVRARVQAADLLGPLQKPLDLEALPRQIAEWIMTPADGPEEQSATPPDEHPPAQSR